MKNIYLIILGLIALSVIGFSLAFASCGGCGQGSAAAAGTASGSGAIDVGNKICPVTGEKINKDVGEGFKPSPTYEYEGKVYNFCCAGCIDVFKKEPQKYIDKIGHAQK